MIRDRKSNAPKHKYGLKSAKFLGTRRKSVQRPWPGGPTRKGCRTISLLSGNSFQRLWQGSPPRKDTRTILLLPGNAFQRLWPGGSAQERLQNKIVLTRKCLSEIFRSSGQGGPPRKGSRTRFSLPGKALEQHCYYQEMPSRGSGHRVPQERHQKKIVFYQEMHSRGSGGGSRPGKAPEQNCYYLEMPSRGSGQGVPPGTALEQDRSYQEMPSRGFGQGVPQERL